MMIKLVLTKKINPHFCLPGTIQTTGSKDNSKKEHKLWGGGKVGKDRKWTELGHRVSSRYAEGTGEVQRAVHTAGGRQHGPGKKTTEVSLIHISFIDLFFGVSGTKKKVNHMTDDPFTVFSAQDQKSTHWNQWYVVPQGASVYYIACELTGQDAGAA